ncbi:MAG: hypothetical protein JWN48_4777 [Myxococcaceae bacterium]|nr:hypothetical protein [Myxococcaceae bacterium]
MPKRPRALRRTATLAVCLQACLAACGASQHAARTSGQSPWAGRGQECVRPFVGRDSPYGEVLEQAVEDAVLKLVPAEAARTMRAAGLSLLVALALRGTAQQARPSIEMLVTRQDLGMRLISLETQLDAVIFEAECTGELIEAMSFELEDRSDQRELRLALGSLVVGALSAAAAGVWDLTAGNSKGPAALGLSGGLASAALGGAAFVKRSPQMRFMHERNLLQAVVRGSDEAELFPRFVYRLLTLPAADGGPSPRDRLLSHWKAMIERVVEPSERAAAETLLYGSGGIYSQDLMALRERLYDVLESELNAQARDLELLDRFLVRALERSYVREAE